MLPVIEQLASVVGQAVTVIVSPDFPFAALRTTLRTAAWTPGVAMEEIETNSAEVSNSTRYRELARLVVNLKHAVMMSGLWNI